MKIILLHGLGQTPSSWKNTVEAMDRKQDILCPDLSDWLQGKEICYSNLYLALEEYCGQFNEPLNLCGLSLGGILALQYGIEHTEKINSLALIAAQYTMPKKLLRFQNIIFRIMPDSSFQKMGFGKADFISLSNSMVNLDFQHDLGKIRCKVLVICGDKDRQNKAASLQLKEKIPQAGLSIIANAGHEVNIDNPVGLGTELNSFFSK